MNRVNRLLVAAAMAMAAAPAFSAETVLQAIRVKGNGPILDVESALWKTGQAGKRTDAAADSGYAKQPQTGGKRTQSEGCAQRPMAGAAHRVEGPDQERSHRG